MPTTTKQPTERLVGTILRKFPARQVNGVNVYDFEFKTNDSAETVKVSKFGKFNFQNGQVVAFNAAYNEQYNRYTVRGEIENAEFSNGTTDTVPEPDATVIDDTRQYDNTKEVEVTPKKRAAKKTVNAVPSPTTDTHTDVFTNLEFFRAEAETIVQRDIRSAEAFTGAKVTADGALDQIQKVRASLSIESNKRDRVANWNK